MVPSRVAVQLPLFCRNLIFRTAGPAQWRKKTFNVLYSTEDKGGESDELYQNAEFR